MAITATQPFLMLMHGLPGAGKSAFARQFAELAGLTHVSSDRFRYELFDDPKFNTSENNTILRLAAYMSEELLRRGNSVIFDMHLPTQRLRDGLARLVNDHNAELVLVWVQTDQETASWRSQHRDRRRVDDKYAFNLSNGQFDELAQLVKSNFRPKDKLIVVSGKHLFRVQAAAALKRLKELGLMSEQSTLGVGGRVDYARRQIPRISSL